MNFTRRGGASIEFELFQDHALTLRQLADARENNWVLEVLHETVKQRNFLQLQFHIKFFVALIIHISIKLHTFCMSNLGCLQTITNQITKSVS